jgi:hypothetical protein
MGGEGSEAPRPSLSDGRAMSSENGPGATRTRDLLLRSRPRPATASAHQRNSLGKQFIPASQRQPAPVRLSLGTALPIIAGPGVPHGTRPSLTPSAAIA